METHRLYKSDNNDVHGVRPMEQDGQGPGDEKVSSTHREGDVTVLEPATAGFSKGLYDDPLPCYGCGIGWLSFILGFVFPLFWFYATVLYLGNHHLKDPRERAGLAASAIVALIFLVATLIAMLVYWLVHKKLQIS